jgi:hypothetical protein
MNKLTITIKMVLVLTLLSTFNLVAQDQKDNKRLEKTNYSFFLNRTGIHTGNLVRTAYSNYGNLGSRTLNEARMEWPVGSGVTYGYEYIFFVASEVVTDSGETIHIISERYSGANRDVPSQEDHNWGWEPKLGYFNDGDAHKGVDEDLNDNGILDTGEDLNNNGVLDFELFNNKEFPAMNHLPGTWPYDWPEESFVGSPGARRNKWNGFYGAYSRADQESYYVMDDRSNDEFPYFPFPENTEPFLKGGRRGVGIEVSVRNLQWSNPQAEDIIISTYHVKNVSKKPLNKNIVGMYVDADVGQGDSEDDASSFDTIEDITYQWDIEGLDLQGRATGYFGFAFLQSPGLIDGIDNDDDGMVDESQENGIDDDGDWISFSDDNGNGVWDPEEMLNDDIGSDGMGPFDQNYVGSDDDGTQGNGLPDPVEPNYELTDNDEIDQIGLTSYFSGGTGGNFVPKDDESYWQTIIQPGIFTPSNLGFDIAFSYGSGFFNLDPGQTETFAIASLFGNDFEDILRNKRTMQKIYDADFNFVKPPINSSLKAIVGNRKVYLVWDDKAESSRDPIYGNDFEMYKLYRSTDPFFNSIKTISDAFGNPILWEPLAQFDLIDGLEGPHPIPLEGLGVSYDMGTDSGLRHSYVDSLVDNGRTYYYALVSVDKGYDMDFYNRGISEKESLVPISPAESSKIIEVDILGNVITLGINVVVVVPTEPAAGNIPPKFESPVEHVTGNATGSVFASIANPEEVKSRTYEVFFTDDSTLEHLTTDFTILDQESGEVLLEGTSADYESPDFEKQIVDGLKFVFNNDAVAEPKKIEWFSESNLDISMSDPVVSMPIDFEIRFFDKIADTSYSQLSSFRIPVKFQVWNITDNIKMEFQFVDAGIDTSAAIEVGDIITLIAERSGRNFTTTWNLNFSVPGLNTVQIPPIGGDKILVETTKPFSSNDVYSFKTGEWDDQSKQIENILDKIYVVPDPYVAVNSLETKRSAALSGRGERKIDFVNLPMECVISVYSTSGKLVTILNHSTLQDDGRESWDLTTRDGLEVAYGVYFFHVNAPGLGEKIGRFAIIK